MTNWGKVKITVTYPQGRPSPEMERACAEWLALAEHVGRQHACSSQCLFYAGPAIQIGSGAPVEV